MPLNEFNDRRPKEPVPKINLRSKAALESHMQGHHGSDVDAWSHSELRQNHQQLHADNFAVVHKAHTHDSTHGDY